MPYYIAGFNRKIENQDFFGECKTYREAVRSLVEKWRTGQNIVLICAKSKDEFAKLCPAFSKTKEPTSSGDTLKNTKQKYQWIRDVTGSPDEPTGFQIIGTTIPKKKL